MSDPRAQYRSLPIPMPYFAARFGRDGTVLDRDDMTFRVPLPSGRTLAYAAHCSEDPSMTRIDAAAAMRGGRYHKTGE